MDRQYQTRDGRKAVLYCVDADTVQPVHGFIIGDGGPSTWSATGCYMASPGSNRDLLEVPPPAPKLWRAEGWVNVHKACSGHLPVLMEMHRSREDADRNTYGRIACVPITLSGVEGENL